MNAEFSTLSDSELLASFKKCSPRTGDRLVMYPEIQKRNLAMPDEVVLFKTRPRSSSKQENGWEFFIALAMVFVAAYTGFRVMFVIGLIFILDCRFEFIISKSLIVTNKKIMTSFFIFRVFASTQKEISLAKNALYLSVDYMAGFGHSASTLYICPVSGIGEALRYRFFPRITVEIIPRLLFFFKRNGVNFYLNPIPTQVFQDASCIEVPIESPTLEEFCRTCDLGNLLEQANTEYALGWLRLICLIQNNSLPEYLVCHDERITQLIAQDEQFILSLRLPFSFQHWGRSELIFTQNRVIAAIHGLTKKNRIEAALYPNIGLPIFGYISLARHIQINSSRHAIFFSNPYPVISIIEHFAAYE